MANTDEITVLVNGRPFQTEIVDGVQRFVGEQAVKELVRLAIEGYNQGKLDFSDKIPQALKAAPHPNAVVCHMVEANEVGYYGLNEVAVDFYEGLFTLEELIEFETLHGWSVSGFYDSITSRLSNLDLGEQYYDEADGEYYENFDGVFTIENPLWK